MLRAYFGFQRCFDEESEGFVRMWQTEYGRLDLSMKNERIDGVLYSAIIAS